MSNSANYSKTGLVRVTFITLAAASALLLTPMQASPARANALGGAIGGAVFGGILGVPIIGAVSGAIIGGAAADRKRARNRNHYQRQMASRYGRRWGGHK